MFRFIWGQLRGRAGRSVALLAGVLVATTGFVVLTGATTTSRLEVTGTVERNTRAAYDILVRPQGTRTPLEAARGLVRPNYLSGLYGGITTAQYDQVKAVAGVDVAAPIAMLGYSTTPIDMPVDLTDAIDRSLDRQVIRVDRTFLAERGLTHAPAQPIYVYVTKHRLLYPQLGDSYRPDAVRYTDGRAYDTQECGLVAREVLPDGRNAPVCDPAAAQYPILSSLTERQTWTVETFRLLPDGRFEHPQPGSGQYAPASSAANRLVLHLGLTVPFLLAAVDPAAEQRLVGLSGAVVDGRPITTDDRVVDNHYAGGLRSRTLPVLAASRPFLDGAVRAGYTRIVPGRSIAGVRPEDLARTLRAAPAAPAGGSTQHAVSAYRRQLAAGVTGKTCCFGELQRILQPGEAGYDERPGGTLVARTATIDPAVYDDSKLVTPFPRPWLTADTSFRPLTAVAMPPSLQDVRQWRAVGVFDPEKLTGFSDLGRVPLETYEPPKAEGADDRSRAALGGQPLEPSGNPAGYLSAPPLLLTNLAAVPVLLGAGPQAAGRISAIRVRVAGVDGYSERSAERVRLIAEQINRVTGLDVDVTLGSSPAPQTVELPAGSFGRPELRLTENWSALGVASTITKAVDRKSVALFGLVLVVCVLFLGNAVSAAVRDRRPELAVLSCLGWPARRIGALILGEVAALGLAAGLLSVGLAFPLGAALGIGLDWRRALLAVPVALLLALVAGLTPALRAARAHPAAALRPPVATARWVRRPRTLPGLALVNLVRTPGRTLLGAGALAIGVAALTLVTAAAYAFRGAIVGSLLGDTVSLSVRGADAVAAVATVLLGAAAVADVLYLNIRDRAAELATLRAVGWSDAVLGRLVGYEGLLLGTLGALGGAGLGLGGAAWLVGELPPSLVVVAALVALAGALVACLAALVPAALLHRLPTARLLAEE